MTDSRWCQYQHPLSWFAKWIMVLLASFIGGWLVFDWASTEFSTTIAWVFVSIIGVCLIATMIGNRLSFIYQCGKNDSPWHRGSFF